MKGKTRIPYLIPLLTLMWLMANIFAYPKVQQTIEIVSESKQEQKSHSEQLQKSGSEKD